jgi:carboxyl-terminal processing protease
MKRLFPKHHSWLKWVFNGVLWVILTASIATTTMTCFPTAWDSWNDTNSHDAGITQVYNAEQPKAQRLFSEVVSYIENAYVDETFNRQRLSQWTDRYYDKIRNYEDAYVAIDSLILSLNDPYTRFFRPDEYAEQNLTISSKLYGIGVEITILNDAVTITNILPNSPALATKQLMLGDVITHINQTAVEGLSLMEVAKQIRGQKGTALILTVKNTQGEIKNVRVVRDEINVVHVQLQKVPQHPDVGYIRLQSFMGMGISSEFAQILAQVKDKPFLVIDLRNNAGGMLNNAVEIADFFLNNEVIVKVDGRGRTHDAVFQGKKGTAYSGKIVILINQGSASASEVLAGALRDANRSILVGQKSYGKGMVQQIVPLESHKAGLNLTIAQYYTPTGFNLNHVGLTPDVIIPEKEMIQAAQKGRDYVLEEAIHSLKK